MTFKEYVKNICINNGAEFYVQKAYHTKDKNGNDLRAIQCLPDEKAIFQVKNFGKQIDVKAMDLFKYNNEDYLKSLNKDNEKPLDSAKSIKDKQPQEESKPENKPASQTKKNENTR